ncbi:MAG: LON peptidase substrate-binding domain-containing protein [Planctomycetota bacterium]
MESLDLDHPVGLFPLASCPLLPAATIPLHVFEPRYRQLTQDAIEHDRPIAMAMFEGDDYQQDYLGQPPVRPAVCLGRIIRHHELPDGRFHILLQGLARARIDHEVLSPPTLYRQAHLSGIDDRDTLEIDLTAARQALDALCADPALDQLASFKPLREHLTDDLPTPALIDLATLCTAASDDQRYRVLAEPDPNQRAGWLTAHLRELLTTLRAAQRYDLPTDDDGLSLN